MTVTIKDLVRVDKSAVLDGGVQLEWYNSGSERNERYAVGYLFSHGEFSRDKTSAIRIFEMIRESLIDPAQPNVLTVVAGYGQGKTHFALVLANFFARPLDHPIVGKIIDRVRECSDDQTAEHFCYFKQTAKQPQLVVKLSGHTHVDLRRNFLQALRSALNEHEATRGSGFRSTSLEAARWLRSLSEDQQSQTEVFLEERDEVDLVKLIERLENFDANYESVAIEISKELNGVYADFGADTDLEKLITETVDEYCAGKDAPFNKMVILFDELGVYLENWMHDPIRAGNIALQSIIEGCRNRPGKVCLVTFIQKDPNTYTTYAQPGEDEQGVTRFTTRLPTRVHLVANLELVLKNLIQSVDSNRLESFVKTHILHFKSASNRALEALPQYYEEKWSDDKFLN